MEYGCCKGSKRELELKASPALGTDDSGGLASGPTLYYWSASNCPVEEGTINFILGKSRKPEAPPVCIRVRVRVRVCDIYVGTPREASEGGCHKPWSWSYTLGCKLHGRVL